MPACPERQIVQVRPGGDQQDERRDHQQPSEATRLTRLIDRVIGGLCRSPIFRQCFWVVAQAILDLCSGDTNKQVAVYRLIVQTMEVPGKPQFIWGVSKLLDNT